MISKGSDMALTTSISKIKNAYFVGIGGVSMSSLALILKTKGINVSGYDLYHSDNTEMLENSGIQIDYEHNLDNLKNIDTIIYTAAVNKETAPELQYAEDNGISLLTRAELLRMVTDSFRYSVGVSGTHGKSTTTGMISDIFMAYDNQSSVISGCVLPKIGKSYKIGAGNRVVFEACEYKDSFLSMRPSLKLVLNCKLDHVDYFKDIEHIKHSFAKFISTPRTNASYDDSALVNLDCENAVAASKMADCNIKYYSISQKTDFWADNVRFENGYGVFDLYSYDNLILKDIKLKVPGVHNVSNAVAAAGSAIMTSVELEAIKKGLESFSGVARRFERKGVYNGAIIVDDYAHHPDEIKVTLNAAKKMGMNRIICVFQPHTFSRTKALLSEFADSLSLADKVYLADIFPARETNTYGISSKDLQKLIPCSEYYDSFDNIAEKLKNDASKGTLIITMGAGEAYKCADILLSANDID